MPDDFGGLEFIEVRHVRGAMKKRLMRAEGGACLLTVGDVLRILSHTPAMDAPLGRLPWPLSKMQPHEIRYVEMTRGTRTAVHMFSGAQVDAAIEHFLRGVNPSVEVQLQQ